ncbi:MAG TPA: S41 family peptidase [Flavobacterium sp.]|nr:S41 family peptidase [Flavobacterium sp.]
MKNIFLFTILALSGIRMQAQNPVSYPKDTLISKPELNFEVLWHTFEDNYAFFKLRNIDWHKTYQDYRPKVNAQTSDESLYGIFSQMLTPFQDNHINVIVPNVKQFKSVKPSQFAAEFPTDSLRNAFWTVVDNNLYANGFSKIKTIGADFNGKPLFNYSVSKKQGYLRFNRCFVDGDADNKIDAAAAGKLLDQVFLEFANVKSLIIDVRDNIGGNDEFAFEVASRFTDKKRASMYKRTRKPKGGYEEMLEPETWFIEPKGNKPFLSNVVLLTNDKTVSAGDVFAMIMKELPQVKIIGTDTRGIYSDMYGFTLPNKWLISLSNQRYFNSDMVCYEGTGTPVDLKVENTHQDLETKKDPVLLEALRQLKQ